MKETKWLKTMKLFDYFKTAFRLNATNKQLYKPQIIYLVIRGALILFTGIIFVDLFQSVIPSLVDFSVSDAAGTFAKGLFGLPSIMLILGTLFALFASTYVESGLYSMYAVLVKQQDSEGISFFGGASRHFLSFLGGNILIGLFWTLISVPYLIAGLLSLTLGFIWIPIIIDAILMVWKASVVIDEKGAIDALKQSIAFGKRHLFPASIFIVLKNALTVPFTQSSGGGGSGNFSNLIPSGDESSIFENSSLLQNDTPSIPDFSGFNFDFFSIIIKAAIGVISLATIFTGMIQMLFNIFFALTSVVIYYDDWNIETPAEIEHPDPTDNSDTIKPEVIS